MKLTQTYLIAGSNGYLGSHFSTFLANKDNTVLFYTSRAKVPVKPYRNYHSVDFSSPFDLSEVLKKVDTIFYFISSTGHSYGLDEPQSFIVNNEVSLINLLEAVKNLKKKPRIVYISTRLVYKSNKEQITENQELAPLSIYALNKFSCEQFLKLYSTQYDIKYTIIRPSLVYGQYNNFFKRNGIISHFINQGLDQENIKIFGDGNQKRSIIHITDFCEMLYKSNLKLDGNEIFNLGGEEVLSIGEIGRIIAQLFNVNLVQESWPRGLKNLEVPNIVLNSNKIKRFTSYDCNFKLKTWIDNYYL